VKERLSRAAARFHLPATASAAADGRGERERRDHREEEPPTATASFTYSETIFKLEFLVSKTG
jgi:hypothetical protein